ncbi:hypothetical protein C2E23DRAFT_831161 [Lenzites betulinus]|nr:hypothetical protein C2E23DRAFT_831161 [Lenzites betulinus]
MPLPSSSRPWNAPETDGTIALCSSSDVQRLVTFWDRDSAARDGSETGDDADADGDSDEDTDSSEGYLSARSVPSRSSSPVSPASSPRATRPETPPPPTRRLRLAVLLTHSPALTRALARALSRLTHLTASGLGPRACAFLRDLPCSLHAAQLAFDETWVSSVCGAAPTPSNADSTYSSANTSACTLVPALPNGDSSGLPTPAPSPATTPAATATYHRGVYLHARAHSQGDAGILPDPVSLLAHSMRTLRVLHASDVVLATVADTVRYPALRELRLRLVGVPIVTPLVHAFPALQELYVYTPYDGCGARAAAPSTSGSQTGLGLGLGITTDAARDGKSKLKRRGKTEVLAQTQSPQPSPPPLPLLDATCEANRTSQMYSSFPPLARVSGFAPGLYALGLTCPVAHLEVGNVAPRLWLGAGDGASLDKDWERRHAWWGAMPPGGLNEAEMVRRVVADTTPTRIGLTLGRGWWAPNAPAHETAALRTMFDAGEEEGAPTGWAGVKALVVRIEEAGTWPAVTRDLAAMLKPLARTLVTLVLCWDRTSVPFARVPAEDAYHHPPSSASDARAAPTSRLEAFVALLAEEMPALRYVCAEVVRDAPPPAPPPPRDDGSSPCEPQLSRADAPASIWSAAAQNGVAEAVARSPPPTSPSHAPALGGAPQVSCERRFWRVDRAHDARWLCLDELGEGAGARVMREEGLAFADGVRY